jgi:hypothetical protein
MSIDEMVKLALIKHDMMKTKIRGKFASVVCEGQEWMRIFTEMFF